MCLLRLKNQFSNVTSFKQVHGRTGSTALSGPSQTLSLASSSGTPCSAGAQALCPRRPARLHSRPALPLGGPSVRSSEPAWTSLQGPDPPSSVTPLEGHSLGFVVSRAHPAQETGTPDSSGTVLMHDHSMWSPRHVAPPTFRGSCSLRYQLPLRPPGVLSRGQALTALSPSRPTVTPDWQRSPEPGDHSDLTPSVYTPTNELC